MYDYLAISIRQMHQPPPESFARYDGVWNNATDKWFYLLLR